MRGERFANMVLFYEADPRREWSPETDYGVMWQDGHAWPQYRVSWVEATGEFYAVCLASPGSHSRGGHVELLGVAHGRLAAYEAMSGWELQTTNLLDWARHRLAAVVA